MLDNILKSASALGACERLDKVKNFHSLTSLFFTPQGLEFCHKNNFPPLGIFQAHKNEVSDCNMYVDCGCIDRKSTRLNSSHTDISRMPSSA